MLCGEYLGVLIDTLQRFELLQAQLAQLDKDFRQGAIKNKAVVTVRGSQKGRQDHLLEQGSAAGGAGAA